VRLKSPSRIGMSDFERIVALWQAAGLSHRPNGRDTREAFARQLASGLQTAIGVETEAGELVGVVLTTHDGRKGWINRLAVHPDYRRQGIARSLIAAAEARLREQGIEIFAAMVEPGNDESVALFATAGYADWPGLHYFSKRDRPDI
jgi:ribosomal protein S18 acetylase RimI-like enzyme